MRDVCMAESGTFRTSRDVRLESVTRTRAEVRQRRRIYEFTPLMFGHPVLNHFGTVPIPIAVR